MDYSLPPKKPLLYCSKMEGRFYTDPSLLLSRPINPKTPNYTSNKVVVSKSLHDFLDKSKNRGINGRTE
jgi:hypothetical protein